MLTFYVNLCKASRNKVLLQLKAIIEETVDKRKDLIIEVKQKIRETDELFRFYGIRYLLPKYSFFHREHHDIDVLVSSEDYKRTLELLRSNGYLLTSIQSPWKATAAKWKQGRRNAIHVHSKIHWSFEFIRTEELWNRSIDINLDNLLRVRIPCAEHNILILAAHAIFENHEISLSDVFQLEGILRRFRNVDWREIFDIAYKEGWCADLYTFLQAVNYLSSSLYARILVPREFFSYAQKKISPFQKRVIRFAASIEKSSMPYRYSFLHVGISSVHLAFKKHGLCAIFKVLEGLASYIANRLRSSKEI